MNQEKPHQSYKIATGTYATNFENLLSTRIYQRRFFAFNKRRKQTFRNTKEKDNIKISAGLLDYKFLYTTIRNIPELPSLYNIVPDSLIFRVAVFPMFPFLFHC